MALVTVPKPLREKLGDEASDALVSLINQAGNGYKTETVELVEERFERRVSEEVAKLERHITEEVGKLDHRITEEVGKLDHRITEEVGKLDRRITEEVAKLNERMATLDVKLSETKADLLRWMFIFWVGQVGALLGILFAFFRH
jgi:bifunctional DNA-binding transcriptional regulator/antitoxin component of YhaV-PrlF toxin-antitoxin module